jgi:hypothetical protein
MVVRIKILLFYTVTECKQANRYNIMRKILSSAPNMETVCFYGILVSTYDSTQHHNLEQYHHARKFQGGSNIKSKAYLETFFFYRGCTCFYQLHFTQCFHNFMSYTAMNGRMTVNEKQRKRMPLHPNLSTIAWRG